MIKITRKQRLILSTILIAISYILFKIKGYFEPTIIFMFLSSIIAGLPIFKKAISSLKYRIIGIDALVTIAVIGAFIIGEYFEAAAVTYLFMLGDYLEAKTIEKTRSSIKELLDFAPTITRVIRNNIEIEINPDDVLQGDIVKVKPGEKISIDGKVVEGSAYLNEANITGEGVPVNKSINDYVYSGTIVESGYLLINAEKVGEDTTFSRILSMVEEAQDKKAKSQKFIERFSKYYTPAIIILSIIAYIIKKDIYLSLTLLVIACPGALVISTPVSIVAGIGNGAKKGILFKGGEVIERLNKAKVIAFDKTGTLTYGKPAVTKINSFKYSENQLLKIAAIGENYSEHPLAKAIIKKAKEEHIDINEMAENVEIMTGKGIKFKYHGQNYLIGNRKLFEENKINLSKFEYLINNEEELGQTTIIIGNDSEILGIISIADKVRESSKTLIKNLKKRKIKQLIMLTGDNITVANAIAEEVELDKYYGSLLPEDKVKVINELQKQYGTVVMVGDGVNDAPALATADLGIAVGGVGKDVAMETADIILVSEKIERLLIAIDLSKATKRNIYQNVIFALIVVAVLISGVLLKSINLSIGMLVHELSVLLVIANAVRLLKYNKHDKI